MHVRRKKVADQVIVITSASSGIGLATARRRGARRACGASGARAGWRPRVRDARQARADRYARAILACAERPVREVVVGGDPRARIAAAVLHPTRTALAAAGIGLAVAAGVRAMRNR